MTYGTSLLFPFARVIILLRDPSAVKNLFINNHFPGTESLDPNSSPNRLGVSVWRILWRALHEIQMCPLPLLCASQSWIIEWRNDRDPARRALTSIIRNLLKHWAEKMSPHNIFDCFVSFRVQFAWKGWLGQKHLNNRPSTEQFLHIYSTQH